MSDTDDTNDSEPQTIRGRIPWRRLASIAGVILLIAIVIPFVIYAVPQVVGGQGSYVVLSGSMEPAMSPGDVIIIDGADASAIEQGDVITFRRGGETRPTTHRVVEVADGEGAPAFRTQGDANENPDQQLVSPGDIEGKVMSIGGYLFVIPYLGYVLRFTNTQMGFVALFVVPLVLLVLSEIWELTKSVQTDSDDESSAGEATDASAASASEATTSDSPEHATADTDDGDDGAMTFTAPELQLALIILVMFLGYSLWVAYVTLEVWSFAAAGSVATAFLLLASVYVFGGGAAGADETVAESESESETETATEVDASPADDLLPTDSDQNKIIFPDEIPSPDDETDTPAAEIESPFDPLGSDPENRAPGSTNESSEGESDD